MRALSAVAVNAIVISRRLRLGCLGVGVRVRTQVLSLGPTGGSRGHVERVKAANFDES